MLQRKRGGWYRKKSFKHFDLPLAFDGAASIVENPERVAMHSFFPFLGFSDIKRRYRNDPNQDRTKPKQLRPKIISKKERPLKYCAHVDGYIHSYYANKLQVQYEAELKKRNLSSNVLGYRRGNGTNVQMANEAFEEIRSRMNCCAIALDIEKFFDTIDHRVLKKNLMAILSVQRLADDWMKILQSMTRYCWVEQKDAEIALGNTWNNLPQRICSVADFRSKIRAQGFVRKNPHLWGIPQGSPISAVF